MRRKGACHAAVGALQRDNFRSGRPYPAGSGMAGGRGDGAAGMCQTGAGAGRSRDGRRLGNRARGGGFSGRAGRLDPVRTGKRSGIFCGRADLGAEEGASRHFRGEQPGGGIRGAFLPFFPCSEGICAGTGSGSGAVQAGADQKACRGRNEKLCVPQRHGRRAGGGNDDARIPAGYFIY